MALATCLTVPSPETVATAVLPMLQVGVEEVPLTFTWKACPASRVKSVRLRTGRRRRGAAPAGGGCAGGDGVVNQTGLGDAAGHGGGDGGAACLLPWLTLPFSSTDTTSGSLLLQVIFPAERRG